MGDFVAAVLLFEYLPCIMVQSVLAGWFPPMRQESSYICLTA